MNYNKMSDNAKIKALYERLDEVNSEIKNMDTKHEELKEKALNPLYKESDKILKEISILEKKRLSKKIGKCYKDSYRQRYINILAMCGDFHLHAIIITDNSISFAVTSLDDFEDLEEITLDEYGNIFDKKVVNFKRRIIKD